MTQPQGKEVFGKYFRLLRKQLKMKKKKTNIENEKI